MAALTTAAIVGAAVVGAAGQAYQANKQAKLARQQKKLQEEQLRRAREEAALTQTRENSGASVVLGRGEEGKTAGTGYGAIGTSLTSNRVGGLSGRGTTVGL